MEHGSLEKGLTKPDEELMTSRPYHAGFCVSLNSFFRVLLLMFILVILGCGGPGSAFTRDGAEHRQEPCSSREQKAERDYQQSATCRSDRTWFEGIGDALSGAASAVRMPQP